jgi:hypothetical protein
LGPGSMLDHPIRWFNHNEGFAIVLLTALALPIAVAAWITALQALKLSKRQHRDAGRPIIDFDLKRHTYGDEPQAHLVVKNVGGGPALNGRLVWDSASAKGIGLWITDPGFPLTIRGGDDLVVDLAVDGIGAAIALSSSDELAPEPVGFEYRDVNGNTGRSTALLRWTNPTDIDLDFLQVSETTRTLP